jgi:toxin HigB-1
MLRVVIQSFADADTERVWQRERVRRFGSDLQRMANRKLLIIDAAETLDDLRVPPGNRLERLRGNRAGQYSIRINDQWRICFSWAAAGAANVEITDYH